MGKMLLTILNKNRSTIILTENGLNIPITKKKHDIIKEITMSYV